MALARALVEHPAEVRADFQEHYGLDIDRMGEAFSCLHAADLLMQLPEGARTRAACDPRAVWTSDRTLAAATVNALHNLVWMQSKDGRRGRNRPKPIGPFEDRTRRKGEGMAMTIEELEEHLARVRTEVLDG